MLTTVYLQVVCKPLKNLQRIPHDKCSKCSELCSNKVNPFYRYSGGKIKTVCDSEYVKIFLMALQRRNCLQNIFKSFSKTAIKHHRTFFRNPNKSDS